LHLRGAQRRLRNNISHKLLWKNLLQTLRVGAAQNVLIEILVAAQIDKSLNIRLARMGSFVAQLHLVVMESLDNSVCDYLCLCDRSFRLSDVIYNLQLMAYPCDEIDYDVWLKDLTEINMGFCAVFCRKDLMLPGSNKFSA